MFHGVMFHGVRLGLLENGRPEKENGRPGYRSFIVVIWGQKQHRKQFGIQYFCLPQW
jgi:hypothetical protein